MTFPTGLLRQQVSVAPTTTTLATIDVRSARACVVHVKNLDVTQRLSVVISSRAFPGIDSAPSGLMPTPIEPGASASVQIDTRCLAELLLEGTAEGAGLTAEVTVGSTST